MRAVTASGEMTVIAPTPVAAPQMKSRLLTIVVISCPTSLTNHGGAVSRIVGSVVALERCRFGAWGAAVTSDKISYVKLISEKAGKTGGKLLRWN
jgi:hypothetical protein